MGRRNHEDTVYKTVTIYNWKDGYIPTGEYEWHIGGHDYDARLQSQIRIDYQWIV